MFNHYLFYDIIIYEVPNMKLKDEFLNKYRLLFKDDFTSFINGFDMPRSYGLRLNSLKLTNYENNSYLKSILIPNPLVQDGYYYHESTHPGRHPYHFAGVYYIQDPSAMMVTLNADIALGDVVFDMCAAPGGKSTHILSKLNGTGLLITNEIISKRAKILSENIERMGATNALVISCDPQKLNKEFYGFFDKVIVDSPCSGEGMFRKDEQAITEWSQENVLSCSILQKSLLDVAYQLVKKDGLILYSTCTFSPEENEESIQYILKKYPDLELLPTIKNDKIKDGLNNDTKNCSRFYFHEFNGEGHFIAKIKKHNLTEMYKKHTSKSLKKASKDQLDLFYKFKDSYLINFNITNEIYDFNQNLYTLNSNQVLPNLDTISIVRYGLHLGEIKKNRFEPSHSLALALKPGQAKYVINFSSDDADVIKYLSGETITYPGNNHFTLITVDGFPLGWVKQVFNVLKNYYPKGLRIKR